MNMACIRAETGTLIYAIINLIVVVVTNVIFIVMLSNGLIARSIGPYRVDDGYMPPNAIYYTRTMYPPSMEFLAVVASLLAFSLIDLIFSSVLMDGILNKKPGHIKAYFVFGIIKVVIVELILIVLSVVIAGMIVFIFGFPDLGFFGLILLMIRATYKQYEGGNNNDQLGHIKGLKRFVEKC